MSSGHVLILSSFYQAYEFYIAIMLIVRSHKDTRTSPPMGRLVLGEL